MIRRKFIIIFALISLLTSCSYFNMDHNPCNDRFARYREAKRRLMFINATNNELSQTQRNAEVDNLNRSVRDNDICRRCWY